MSSLLQPKYSWEFLTKIIGLLPQFFPEIYTSSTVFIDAILALLNNDSAKLQEIINEWDTKMILLS